VLPAASGSSTGEPVFCSNCQQRSFTRAVEAAACVEGEMQVFAGKWSIALNYAALTRFGTHLLGAVHKLGLFTVCPEAQLARLVVCGSSELLTCQEAMRSFFADVMLWDCPTQSQGLRGEHLPMKQPLLYSRLQQWHCCVTWCVMIVNQQHVYCMLVPCLFTTRSGLACAAPWAD
jgi:hypothetical protein